MVIVTKFGSYEDNLAKFVRPTVLCDFDVAELKKQANLLKNEAKSARDAVRVAHAFVAALPLGFDRDDLSASRILKKGRGQCNTKTTLLVALLRAMGVPARVYAWRVKKAVHKDRFPWLVYVFAPRTTVFVYPEVFLDDTWMLLSTALKPSGKPVWDVCPFDDAAHRAHPLRKEWIAEDLGSFWHPDVVYAKYGTNADGWRRIAFPFAQALLNR